MHTLTAGPARRRILRHSPWDALLVALSVVHAAVLASRPPLAVIALALWWNANTIAHTSSICRSLLRHG
jgi:hypothetical protein